MHRCMAESAGGKVGTMLEVCLCLFPTEAIVHTSRFLDGYELENMVNLMLM